MVSEENGKEFLDFEDSLEELSKVPYDFYGNEDFEEQMKSLKEDKKISSEREKLFTASLENFNLRFSL